MSTAVRVALPVPLPTLFDYLPPADGQVVVAGQRVLVPFGRGQQVGLVVDAVVTSERDESRLKPVLKVLDHEPLLDGELLRTLTWAADYWLGAPGKRSPRHCRWRCASRDRCRTSPRNTGSSRRPGNRSTAPAAGEAAAGTCLAC